MAAMIVQFAISRSREYEADREGAAICGNPLWLASALQRIEAGVHGTRSPAAESHPATVPLFIVNPLAGGAIDSLFSKHPATANRVAALQALAGRADGGAALARGLLQRRALDRQRHKGAKRAVTLISARTCNGSALTKRIGSANGAERVINDQPGGRAKSRGRAGEPKQKIFIESICR